MHFARILSVSLVNSRILCIMVSNKSLVLEICSILGVSVLKFWVFHGFWVGISACRFKLKWMCRISCLSVTGKVWNSWKGIHIFHKFGQFWGASQTHWMSNASVSQCFYGSEGTLLGFLFEIFASFRCKEFPPFPKRKDR